MSSVQAVYSAIASAKVIIKRVVKVMPTVIKAVKEFSNFLKEDNNDELQREDVKSTEGAKETSTVNLLGKLMKEFLDEKGLTDTVNDGLEFVGESLETLNKVLLTAMVILEFVPTSMEQDV